MPSVLSVISFGEDITDVLVGVPQCPGVVRAQPVASSTPSPINEEPSLPFFPIRTASLTIYTSYPPPWCLYTRGVGSCDTALRFPKILRGLLSF